MPLVLAIDVGGTSARLGLIDPTNSRIHSRSALPTPPLIEAGLPFLDAVARAAERLSETSPVDAVGISLCELVSSDGEIESGHRVPWRAGEVLDRFSAFEHVIIEADVRAAALAEARLGAGRDVDPFLYLNIGTGIAATLVLGGLPYRGAHGHALVIASGPTTCRCPQCGSVSESVLEDVAGGAGLAAHYARLVDKPLDVPDILSQADAGEATALEVVTAATTALASTLGPVLGMLDPMALVIGGGLGSAPGPYFEALVPAIRRHVWSPRTRAITIRQATLGSDAGLIGAALTAVTS